MIFGNRAEEIGDTILIVARAPIIGIVELNGFSDEIIGELPDRFFFREFSYSVDGLFFTPFQELTIQAIATITITSTDTFYINYKYTRQGTNADGFIAFDSITLSGSFEQPLCNNYYILPKSIFKDIFCYNPEHLGLCVVLTNKCFEEGIVPKFLTRNTTNNPAVDDKDYIDFWDAVCCFYALLIVFARKFQNYGRERGMLSAYLQQYNHFFCNDIDLASLLYVKQHQYNEIKKRGTLQIFSTKAENAIIDGEFLRMICYRPSNELLIAPIISQWLVDVSSPTYGGFVEHIWLNKVKDRSLNQFMVDDQYGSVIEDIDGSINITSVSGGQSCGLNYNADQIEKSIIISEKIDYKISFDIVSEIENEAIITFGIVALDKDNNIVNCKNVNTSSSDENNFFTRIALPSNSTYNIVAVLYNSDQSQLFQSIPNVGVGQNLRVGLNTEKVNIKILLDRVDLDGIIFSAITISNIKIEPLVCGNRVNKKEIVVSSISAPTIDKIWYNPNLNEYREYNQLSSVWIIIDDLQETLVNLQKESHYQNSSFLDRDQMQMLLFKNNSDLTLDSIKTNLERYLSDYSSKYLITTLN